MMAFIKLISIDGTELCVGEGETGTLNRDTTMRYSSEYTNYVPNPSFPTDESKVPIAKESVNKPTFYWQF